MAVLLVVLWSSGFVGAVLGTRYAGADTLLAWRYVVAAGVLAGAVAVWRPPLSPAMVRRQAVVGTLCQTCYLGGIVTGVGLGVPAGTAALVAALQPLLVAAAAGPLLGEPVARRQWEGLGLGLVGVTTVVAGDLGASDGPWWAYLLVVGGTLALSAGTVLDRRWAAADDLLGTLAVHAAVAAGTFVALAAAADRLAPPPEPAFWWAVAWVVGLSTFGGYGTYLVVLRRSGATRVSALLYLTPPTTTLWALVMFGQRPGWLALAGLAVCAAAVHRVLSRPAPRVRDSVGV